MESPKNTHITLSNLGQLLKDKMTLVKHESKQINNLKEEIRGILQENNIPHFENKELNIDITINYPKTFDFGLFKLEYPKLTKRYFTEETITTVRDVYDKKKIKKECPKEYKMCEIELTPRLKIK